MRIAPDKNDPFPRPRDNVGTNGNGNGNNGGGNGGGRGASFEPGAVNRYVEEQVAIHGGDPAKWRAHYKSIYSPVSMPDYSWEKGGNGNGNGGKNPNGTGPGNNPDQPDLTFNPSSPGHRMAPMQMPYGAQPGAQMMQQPMQGLLNVGPMGQMTPPTLGLLGQPQQTQQRKPQAGILPPEIQALLTQRR